MNQPSVPHPEPPSHLPSHLIPQGCISTDDVFLSLAAAAKSLQSCPTLCDPITGSPLGPSVPGILQAKHWSGLPFPSPVHESEK